MMNSHWHLVQHLSHSTWKICGDSCQSEGKCKPGFAIRGARRPGPGSYYDPVVLLYERALTSENPRSSFSDELLKQLLKWFKFEFFSWTNQPKCHVCSGPTTFVGGSDPTMEEQRGHAGRVEVYTCAAQR